jgi:hypothetical protein
VQRNGVVTRKNSPDILMVVFMLSPDDSFDQLYIATTRCCRCATDLLARRHRRHPEFGARDYSMRLWLDPDKICNARHDVRGDRRDPCANPADHGWADGEPPISDRRIPAQSPPSPGGSNDQKQFEDTLSGPARRPHGCGCATWVARIELTVRCPMHDQQFLLRNIRRSR